MAEAGCADGFDLELTTNTTERRRNEAVIIQDNLAKIGIRVKINLMQGSQFFEKFRKQGFQMAINGWGSDYSDADANANAFANHRMHQIGWRCAWYDDYAADLVEAAGKEINEDRRFQMYQDLTNYWLINSPIAIMFQLNVFWGVRNEVKGFDKATEGYGVRFDFTQMYK